MLQLWSDMIVMDMGNPIEPCQVASKLAVARWVWSITYFTPWELFDQCECRDFNQNIHFAGVGTWAQVYTWTTIALTVHFPVMSEHKTAKKLALVLTMLVLKLKSQHRAELFSKGLHKTFNLCCKILFYTLVGFRVRNAILHTMIYTNVCDRF